jgi:hypothetical protein
VFETNSISAASNLAVEGEVLILKRVVWLFLVWLLVVPAFGATKRAQKPKKAPAKSAVRSMEDAAWSSPSRPAKQVSKPKAQPAKGELKSTVKYTNVQKPSKDKDATKVPVKPVQGGASVSKDTPPGLPFGDLSSKEEEERYLADLDEASKSIVLKLDRLYGRKPTPTERLPKGIAGARSYQAELEKALADPGFSKEDIEELKSLKHQRDSALYMLGCVYITRNNKEKAAEALSLAAKSQGPGSQIYEAAQVELSRLGKPL